MELDTTIDHLYLIATCWIENSVQLKQIFQFDWCGDEKSANQYLCKIILIFWLVAQRTLPTRKYGKQLVLFPFRIYQYMRLAMAIGVNVIDLQTAAFAFIRPLYRSISANLTVPQLHIDFVYRIISFLFLFWKKKHSCELIIMKISLFQL